MLQTSITDNGVENISVSSWEALEERSGAASAANSLQAMNSSVLWVPDHAVSRCTSCKTEFWLGRRKHHCRLVAANFKTVSILRLNASFLSAPIRSCGQIFCADCSEFWAALPDERLYEPVRLCGPCYHNVTTKVQVSSFIRYKLCRGAILIRTESN